MTEIAGELNGSTIVEESSVRVVDMPNSLQHFKKEQEKQEEEKQEKWIRGGRGKRGPPEFIEKQVDCKNVLTTISVKEEFLEVVEMNVAGE